MSAEDEKKEDKCSTDIWILEILVKSANNLPDLDFGSKDKTDPVCKVSFKDPSNGGIYVWRTEEIFDELDPKWNESNSWPLFFKPPNDLLISFEIFDIDSFSHADKCGKVLLKLSDINGKPKVLKGKKCKANTTITVECRVQRLRFVPENFVENVNKRLNVDADKDVKYETVDNINKKLENYAKLDTFVGLQSTVQKIQADNISNAQTYVKIEKYKQLEQKMEIMQKEYENKLNELQNEFRQKMDVITSKFEGIKNVLTD